MESKRYPVKVTQEDGLQTQIMDTKNYLETPEASKRGSSDGCLSASSSTRLAPSSAEPRARRPSSQDYKPTALRWWFQLLLVTCFAVLIGLTEHAIRTLDMYATDYSDLASQLVKARYVGERSRYHARLTVESKISELLPVRQDLTSTSPSSFVGPSAAGATTSPLTGQTSSTSSTSNPTTTDVKGPSTSYSTGTETGSLLGSQTTSTLVPIVTGPSGYVGSKTTSTVSSDIMTFSTGSNGFILNSKTTRTVAASTASVGFILNTDTTTTSTVGLTSYFFGDKPPLTPTPSAPSASVTVGIVKQTTTVPPSEVTSERTITDSNGRVSTETFRSQAGGGIGTTELTATINDEHMGSPVVQQTVIESGRTNVVQSTVEAQRSGATLIAQPSVVETVVGGEARYEETTYTDSQGNVQTSSYSTILGGTLSLSTIAVLMTTSVLPGDTLVTHEVVQATTLGGSTEILTSAFMGSDGTVTSSAYTTVIGGTPTSTTFWTVRATSAPAGETLITVPTAVPVTRGGSTEVLSATYTDAQGHVQTSSYSTMIGGTAGSETLWTVVAIPTPTQGAGSSSIAQPVSVVVIGTSPSEYALGTFFPTIVATLLCFAIKLISINARLMQPFHALASTDKRQGASLESSMFLRFYSWSGSLSFTRALWFRQPIIAISDILVLFAGLLAPFAAETVSVYKYDETCESLCYGTLGVTLVPGRVLQSLMSAIAVLLLVLIALLSVRRWKTGVSHNPWSIAGIASLCLDANLRRVLMDLPKTSSGIVEDSSILEALAGKRFGIGDIGTSSPYSGAGTYEHGIVVYESDPPNQSSQQQEAVEVPTSISKPTQPFPLLTWWGRCIQLFIFSSVLIIITYYENTGKDTGFERFLDSQDFGVQFFFTALGVLLGYLMETMFRCKCAQKESKCYLD